MEQNSEIAGYVSAIRSSTDQEIFYLWQIGVAPQFTRNGYGLILIQKVVEAVKNLGGKSLQFSIAPENKASYNTFYAAARTYGLEMTQVDDLGFSDVLTGAAEFEKIYEYKL